MPHISYARVIANYQAPYPDPLSARAGDKVEYDAVELTIQKGEMLTCHAEQSDFLWATNRAGHSGWVPISHVEFCSPETAPI